MMASVCASAQVVNEDFNATNGSWTGSSDMGGTYWEWGDPTGTLINDDNGGGGNAWVIGLTGDFSVDQFDGIYLTSQNYNLSSVTSSGLVSMAIYRDLGTFNDGFEDVNDPVIFEYSIDNGMSWAPIGTSMSGTNWYNDPMFDAWTLSSGGWVTATHELPAEILGEAAVQFRFSMFTTAPTGTYGKEGFAVDDFQIVTGNTGTDFLTMSVAGELFSSTIDNASKTVTLFVPEGTDVTNLAPTFTLSTGATSNITSGTPQDFTNPVTYTITAEVTSIVENWTVQVVNPTPTISVFPSSGIVGTEVSIYGKGFSTTIADNNVSFGGVSATVSSASNNKLVVNVPVGASLGINEVSVISNGLNYFSEPNFTVVSSGTSAVFTDYKLSDFDLAISKAISLEVADFDADGDLDFAYDDGVNLKIATLENGVITNTVTVVSGRSATTTTLILAVSDVDKDGYPDIIAAGARLGWFKNNGDGTWGDEQVIEATAYESILIFDADTDFDEDVFVFDGTSVSLFKNSGSQSFSLANASVADRLGVPIDWDEDGDLDLIIVGQDDMSFQESILLLTNNGGGAFTSSTLATTSLTGLESVQVGDLDNDGDNDFAYVDYDQFSGNNSIGYIVNNGDGTFAAEVSISANTTPQETKQLKLADLNGDGFLDIARTTDDGFGDGWFYIYLSSASLTYSETELDGSIAGQDVELVDINNDGDLDILQESSASGGYFPLYVQGSTDLNILDFSFAEQTGPATINGTAFTVSAEVATGTDLTMLVPTIELASDAVYSNPSSGVAGDFSSSSTYTVRTVDNRSATMQDWTVTVAEAPSIPVVSSSNIEQTTATLSWIKSSAGVNYELELSEVNDFSTLVTGYDPLVISNPTTSTVATDLVNLNAGTAYYVRVREQNAVGTFSAFSVTINFTTKLPSQPDLSSLRVDENVAVGTLVGAFSVTDADGASYTYAFADGGVDNTSFAINGSNLETNEVFNREAKEEYSIRVESVNSLGVTSDPKEFTITINDLNDSPTNISLQTGSYSPTGYDMEGTPVADLFVTDEDGDNVTFVLTQGGDSFEVNNVTKTLLTKVVFETEVDLIIPITLEASDPSGASVSANFDVTINAFVDTEKPLISPSPQNGNTFLSGGPERSLSVTVTDFRLSQVKFFSRLLTESEFVDEVLTEVDGAYTKTVVEADLGVAGFEYYFEATDDAGNVGFSELKTMALSFPESGENAPKVESVTKFGRTVDSYQIISIPFAFNDPSAKRVDAIFNEYSGDEINTEYRIIRWDPTRGESGELVNLDQASIIELGEGYFFISAKERSITIESANINLVDPFPLVLKQGWNLVGNPYNINMDWNSVLTNNNANGIVGALRVLDPENPETWPESNVLKTLEGAFVFANQDITLSMSYTDASISFGGGRVTNGAPEADWFLPITLEQNGDFRKGGIGMDASASTSLDMYDEPVLPKWLEYLEIAFLHEGERFSRFNKDVTPFEDTRVWEFEVSSSSDGSSTLKWDESSAQVTNLKLYNTQNGAVIDMTKQSSYEFKLKGTAKFKILYSVDPNVTFDFEQLGVLEAYPNPFVESFSVPLRLPSNGFDYEVRVELKDLSGRTIYTGETEITSGGAMEYSFDRPQGLKQGVYLYKVSIENALISESYTKRIKVN